MSNRECCTGLYQLTNYLRTFEKSALEDKPYFYFISCEITSLAERYSEFEAVHGLECTGLCKCYISNGTVEVLMHFFYESSRALQFNYVVQQSVQIGIV